MLDQWPSGFFVPRDIAWRRSSVSNVSESVNGLRRSIVTDGGGYWSLELSDIPLWSPQKLKLARAMALRIGDGVTPVIIDTCERAFSPKVAASGDGRVGHSDGSPFSDDSLYASGRVLAFLAAPAALRSTQIAIKMVAGSALVGGEAFSVRHAPPSGYDDGKRRYEIGGVSDPIDGVQVVSIWPPFRADTAAEVEVDFDRVGCAMTLINPEDFMSAISGRRFGGMNPRFQEAF